MKSKYRQFILIYSRSVTLNTINLIVHYYFVTDRVVFINFIF